MNAVLTDQGREFVNKVNERICEEWNIKHKVTAAYHPQTIGLDERTNQTLKATLRKMVNERQSDWDAYIDGVLFAQRTKPQSSTKYSPFFLLYGREAVYPSQLPNNFGDSNIKPLETTEETVNDHVENITKTMSQTKERVTENVAKAQKKQKKEYKKRSEMGRRNQSLKVGDLVLIFNSKKTITKRKGNLLPNYTGPYKISSIDGKTTTLESSTGVILKTKYNIDRLKSFNQRMDHTSLIDQEIPSTKDTEDSDQEQGQEIPSKKDTEDSDQEQDQEITSNQEMDSDLEQVLKTLWSSPQSDIPVLRIGPYVLSTNSFHFLKNTLSDEVIDAYLHILIKGENALHINCVVGTAIFENNDQIHRLLRNENLYMYDSCLTVINEGGHHWSLVIIEPKTKTLTYMNPMGELRRKQEQVLLRWYSFLNSRYTAGLDTEFPGNWSLKKVIHSKQKDGMSCGVYSVKFAESFLNCDGYIFAWDKKKIMEERMTIGKRLISCGFPMSEVAEMSGIVENIDHQDYTMKTSKRKVDTTDDADRELAYCSKITIKLKEKRKSFVYPKLKKNALFFCICNQRNDGRKYWQCEDCEEWFHPECVGLEKIPEPEHFSCPKCKSSDSKTESMHGFPREVVYSQLPNIIIQLYQIMTCDDTQCENPKHVRHHKFLRTPLLVYNRERFVHCFGECKFNAELSELLSNLLMEKLLFLQTDPVRIYSGPRVRMIKDLPACSLKETFLLHHGIADNYMLFVCLKEVMVLLECRRSGATYEIINKMFSETEKNMKSVAREFH